MLIRYLWPPIVWTLFILVLTLLPGRAIPNVGIFQIDKLVHIFFFSVLMVLLLYGLQKINEHRIFFVNLILIAIVYCIGLGIIIEILQLFVPGRDFSLLDIVADASGTGLGYLIFIFVRKITS